MDTGNLAEALVLAVAIGSASFTITSSKISMPIRMRVATRAVETKSPRWRWLSELLACPFCVSHWLAFGAVLIYQPWLVDAPGWFGRVSDFLATSIAMTVVSMIAVAVIKRALAASGAPPAAPAASPKPERTAVR